MGLLDDPVAVAGDEVALEGLGAAAEGAVGGGVAEGMAGGHLSPAGEGLRGEEEGVLDLEAAAVLLEAGIGNEGADLEAGFQGGAPKEAAIGDCLQKEEVRVEFQGGVDAGLEPFAARGAAGGRRRGGVETVGMRPDFLVAQEEVGAAGFERGDIGREEVREEPVVILHHTGIGAAEERAAGEGLVNISRAAEPRGIGTVGDAVVREGSDDRPALLRG